MSQDVIEAYDRGHKSGFMQGYRTAAQDIRSLLCGIRDRVDPDDFAAVEARYHEIFQGLDNPNQVIEALEVIQEALA